MRVLSKMLLAAFALGALTTSASAAIQLVGSQPSDLPIGGGQTLVDTFDAAPNALFTYNGQIHIGNFTNFWAAPAGDATHYGIASDVGSPTNATFTIAPGHELTSFSAYLGSLDDYNSLQFLDSHGNVVTTALYGNVVDGNELANFAAGHNADHSTTSTDSNRRFFFTFAASDDVTEVLFHSNGRAFEFDDFAASWVSTVPEPATWAMMILGFGFVGFMMRSNRQKMAAISA